MPSQELTLKDHQLLQLAANGKSPIEIAEETGIAPEAVALRIRELLSSRDIWNDLEREKLLIHSIYELKTRLEKNIDTVVFDPKLLKEYRGLLDLLGQRLEARTRITDADLEKVSKAQGLRLIHVVEIAYYKAREALIRAYPDVDLEVLDNAMNLGLQEAAMELEAVQDGPFS